MIAYHYSTLLAFGISGSTTPTAFTMELICDKSQRLQVMTIVTRTLYVAGVPDQPLQSTVKLR